MRPWCCAALALSWCLLAAGCVIDPPEIDGGPSVTDQGLELTYVDAGAPVLAWLDRHRDDPRAARVRERLGPDRAWGEGEAVQLSWRADDLADTLGRVVSDAARPAAGPGARPVAALPYVVLHPARLTTLPDCDEPAPAPGRERADALAEAIGGRPVVVVVMSAGVEAARCRAAAAVRSRAERWDQELVDALRSDGTVVLLGVGRIRDRDPGSVAEVFDRLGRLDDVDGLAVDVGGYATQRQKTAWGRALRERLGEEELVLVADAGRAGTGRERVDACDPQTASTLAPRPLPSRAEDVRLLWLTPPGSSDGSCPATPRIAAGEFSPDFALRLTRDLP